MSRRLVVIGLTMMVSWVWCACAEQGSEGELGSGQSEDWEFVPPEGERFDDGSEPEEPDDDDGGVQTVRRQPLGYTLPPIPVELDEPLRTPWLTSHGAAVAGERLYITDPDNDTVVAVATDTFRVVAERRIGGRPDQVVVGEDGTLFVSLRHGRSVVALDPESLAVREETVVGLEPIGLAMDSAQETLFVAVAGDDLVVALDAATLELVAVRELEFDRRPRALVYDPGGALRIAVDGNRIVELEWVAGDREFVPERRWDRLRERRPTLLWVANLAFEPIANRTMALAYRPSHQDVLALHHTSMPGHESMALEMFFLGIDRGEGEGAGEEDGGYGAGGPVRTEHPHAVPPVVGTVTSTREEESQVPPVLDSASGTPLDVMIGAPSDLLLHPTHSLGFVSSVTHDMVIVMNTAVADVASAPLGVIEAGDGPGPLAISEDGSTLYIVNRIDFSVAAVDLGPFLEMEPITRPTEPLFHDRFEGPLVQPIRAVADARLSYSSDPLSELAARGRSLFHSATFPGMSEHGHFACVSCHTEGEGDGLVWVIEEGLRQTPSLSGRLNGTAPFNWLGSEETLHGNMIDTVDRMGGGGLSTEQLDALEAFLMEGLVGPPSVDRPLTADEELGAAIFQERCALCHAGSQTTNSLSYDVGIQNSVEEEIALTRRAMGLAADTRTPFNTPSLRHVRYTAPYFHNGTAETLREVLQMTDGTMWTSEGLTDEDVDRLIAYLRTL